MAKETKSEKFLTPEELKKLSTPQLQKLYKENAKTVIEILRCEINKFLDEEEKYSDILDLAAISFVIQNRIEWCKNNSNYNKANEYYLNIKTERKNRKKETIETEKDLSYLGLKRDTPIKRLYEEDVCNACSLHAYTHILYRLEKDRWMTTLWDVADFTNSPEGRKAILNKWSIREIKYEIFKDFINLALQNSPCNEQKGE